jgi:(2Fe-2S) ferredoxin
MPVSSLFELLKGELVDIVDYAVDCHKKTGRPPRLAVNASSWWYANMTAASAKAVRDSESLYCVEIL